MAERELEREGTAFIERFHTSNADERAAVKGAGAALASRLRRRAIDLCMDKATEFSPDVGRFFELAAKVALLTHWPDEEALAQYEQDVGYSDARRQIILRCSSVQHTRSDVGHRGAGVYPL